MKARIVDGVTDIERPEIGRTADAGGIKTNYLDAGEGPADLHVFAHCGHWVQIERSADFNRLVRDFIAG